MKTQIKCGNCGEYHDSVTEVRECCGAQGAPVVRSRAIGVAPRRPSQDQRAASAKQIAFIRKLVVERFPEMTDENRETMVVWTTRSMSAAREAITSLLELPNKVKTASSGDELIASVPAGYYAVELDGRVQFFTVREARQSGRKYLRRVVGGHPEGYPVPAPARRQALEAIIADGLEAAALRYGHEVGNCYRCNRLLTDETSRELGIGPVCRNAS